MAEANAAVAKAEAANAQADLSSSDALIAHLKLEIEKLRHEIYGTRSERKARMLEQMELQLEDLEAAATEDELAAENAAARTQTVQSFQRKRPSRKPFPDHLPRERVVIAAPMWNIKTDRLLRWLDGWIQFSRLSFWGWRRTMVSVRSQALRILTIANSKRAPASMSSPRSLSR